MNIITKEQSDMIDLILEGQQMTDIAKTLGLARSTLYVWINKDIVKAELESRRSQLRKTAKDKITGSVCKLVDNMLDMANNSSDSRVRLQANKYLLDQCIGVPVAVKDVSIDDKSNKSNDTNIVKKELDNIKNLKIV